MKRALAGIVPDELLKRRKKASVPSVSLENAPTDWLALTEKVQHMVCGSLGIIDTNRLLQALHRNEEIPINILSSTLKLESWLRHLTANRVLTNSISTKRQVYTESLEAN
jgi:hypothetical protein